MLRVVTLKTQSCFDHTFCTSPSLRPCVFCYSTTQQALPDQVVCTDECVTLPCGHVSHLKCFDRQSESGDVVCRHCRQEWMMNSTDNLLNTDDLRLHPHERVRRYSMKHRLDSSITPLIFSHAHRWGLQSDTDITAKCTY